MKIMLVDDDQLVCTSLKMILEVHEDVTVVAMGHDGAEVLSLYRQYKPDIILLDIQMKQINGTTALEQLQKEFPDVKVLFLTTFIDDEYIVKALELGAKGYIVKQDYEYIYPALCAVLSGQNVYGSEIMNKLPELMQRSDSFHYESYGISNKEYEIITLVAEGLSNKEIATRLYLSDGTVRNYLSSILEKLELRDRTQLAVFYYQHL